MMLTGWAGGPSICSKVVASRPYGLAATATDRTATATARTAIRLGHTGSAAGTRSNTPSERAPKRAPTSLVEPPSMAVAAGPAGALESGPAAHTRERSPPPPSTRRGGDGRPRLVHERRWCRPPAEPRVGSAEAARAATTWRGSSAAPDAPAAAAALSPAANRLGHTGSAAGMRPGTASRACAETSTQYRSPSRRRGSGRRRGPAGSTSPRGGGERAPPMVRGTARPTRRAPGRGEAHCRQRGGSHCRPQRRRTCWRRAKTSVASRGARR